MFLSIINDLVSFIQSRAGRVFEAHRLPNDLRPLRLQRDRGLTNSVAVELVLPNGCRGVTASPLEIAGDQNTGTLVAELAPAASGLDLRSLTIRATTRDERGLPVTADTPLILVPTR